MAYAAVVSLMQVLEHILHPHLDQRQIPHQKQQIESLFVKINFLFDFLEDSSQKKSRVVQCLEKKIRDAAYKAEDIIEFHLSNNFLQEGIIERKMRHKIFSQHLEMVTEEIDSIKRKVARLRDLWDTTDLHQRNSLAGYTDSPLRLTSSGENTMLGFDDDMLLIMDRLAGQQSKLQVVPIIGMGGIGKTTLSRNVYDDPYISYYFDTRAWITISQEYRMHEILVSLLDSLRKLTDDIRQESTEQLAEILYRCLKGRRFLIVLDDVWSTKAWDDVKRLFPDDNTGSRIMLTTRLSNVAAYASSHGPHHYMHFLNDSESWNLLRHQVFGRECCPLELEEVGRKIAQSCKGLPLAIVVMSGLLSKFKGTQRYWEYVARNANSVVIDNDEQCSELLSISYSHLPHHLKACFLYVGVFPKDYEIPVSKLIKLWAAEGFLKPIRCKSLEELGEEYLEDLISRNLIMVGEKRSDGKIKTCTVHDLLRNLCLRKAQEENFLHVINKRIHSFPEGIKNSRRLSIHPNILHGNFSGDRVLGIDDSMRSFSLVRSLLSFGTGCVAELGDYLRCTLVRVLDLAKVDFSFVPAEILELVHLRYLAFSCKGDIFIPKLLPNYLWNLQTLIIYQTSKSSRITCSAVYLPLAIWRMPRLRHLQVGKCYLPCPQGEPEDEKNLLLENLQILSKISSSSCSKELFERIPSLKKLRILVERSGCDAPFSLDNLINLPQLETLKCLVEHGSHVSVSVNFTILQNLKKLILNRTRLPWKDMSVVGALPNLKVLKLIDYAFEGLEWEPVSGEFCQLTYLLIDGTDLHYWRADSGIFPSLQHLVLWECNKLEEIPYSIGEVPTLEMIELDDSSPSAVTWAKHILEEQQNLGNDGFQLCVHYMWEMIHQKRKENENEAENRRKNKEDMGENERRRSYEMDLNLPRIAIDLAKAVIGI